MITIPKRTFWLAACLLAIFLVSSCGEESPKYIIGVSQCSEDSWRAKLQDELIMATYFNEGEEYVLTYDQKAMTLTADRSKSGVTGFNQNFLKAGGENEAPVVAPVHKKLTSLRLFIDKSSVEAFGNNGEVCITNLVFPKSKFNKVKTLPLTPPVK